MLNFVPRRFWFFSIRHVIKDEHPLKQVTRDVSKQDHARAKHFQILEFVRWRSFRLCWNILFNFSFLAIFSFEKTRMLTFRRAIKAPAETDLVTLWNEKISKSLK